MRFRDVRGLHGAVLEVEDPEREARRWARALRLPVLRRRRGEVVLGSLSFFVILRRAKRAAGIAELHVAVDGLSDRRLVKDDLGGRHAARDLGGVRLIVRELTGPPSRAWLPRRRKKS